MRGESDDDGKRKDKSACLCVFEHVSLHSDVVSMIKCEFPAVNPSGFRHSLSPPLPHSVLLSLSLFSLSTVVFTLEIEVA